MDSSFAQLLETSDTSSSTPFLTTILIDSSFFIVCLIIFYFIYYRSLNVEKVELEEVTPLLESPDSLCKMENIPLLAKYFPFTADLSPASRIYLKFMMFQILFFLLLMILGSAFLIPIYFSYSPKGSDWFIRISASGSSTKIVVFIAVLVVISFFYLFLYLFEKDITVNNNANKTDNNFNVVHLENLPSHITRDFQNEFIEDTMEKVSIINNYNSDTQLNSLIKSKDNVMKYIEENTPTPTSYHSYDNNDNKEDNNAVELETKGKELVDINDQISTIVKTKKFNGSGHAFILFSTSDVASQFISDVNSNRHRFNVKTNDNILKSPIIASIAPAPSDIQWENVGYGSASRFLRIIFGNLLLFFVIVSVTTPASILSALDDILDLNNVESNNSLVDLLLAYFPSLIVLLVNSIICPYLISFTVNYEANLLKSEDIQSTMKKNIIFSFIIVIVLPTLALGSIESFVAFSQHKSISEWNQIIGEIFLSSSGQFVILFLVHFMFLGTGVQLIDLPQFIWMKYKLFFAKSEEQKKKIRTTRWEFNFGSYYSARVTVFGLLLIYSVIVPLSLVFGLGYFLIVYFIDRYMLSRKIYVDPFGTAESSPASKIASSTLSWMETYSAIFLICMTSFFLLQDTLTSYICGVICGILMVFFLIKSCLRNKVSNNIDGPLVDNFETAYSHPLVVEYLLSNSSTNRNDEEKYDGDFEKSYRPYNTMVIKPGKKQMYEE